MQPQSEVYRIFILTEKALFYNRDVLRLNSSLRGICSLFDSLFCLYFSVRSVELSDILCHVEDHFSLLDDCAFLVFSVANIIITRNLREKTSLFLS